MSIQGLISNYARYNHWANEKLVNWLLGLESELIYAQTPSSYSSLALTVRHMQESQQFWLGIIARRSLDLADGVNGGPGLADATKGSPGLPGAAQGDAVGFDRLLAGSTMMMEVFGAYTEEELSEAVASTDMVQSRYEFILHVINHNSYHRGQVVTMCRGLGVVNGIPAMDYEVFLWSGRGME
jgi:uncharacterized damage-inducible protein DinB